jgi:hypothetical protein
MLSLRQDEQGPRKILCLLRESIGEAWQILLRVSDRDCPRGHWMHIDKPGRLGLLVVGPICIGYAYWRAPARDRRLIYYSLADPLGIVGNFIIGPNQRPRATKHNPAVAAKKANMVCKGCGRRLEAGWKLCPWCGLEIR